MISTATKSRMRHWLVDELCGGTSFLQVFTKYQAVEALLRRGANVSGRSFEPVLRQDRRCSMQLIPDWSGFLEVFATWQTALWLSCDEFRGALPQPSSAKDTVMIGFMKCRPHLEMRDET